MTSGKYSPTVSDFYYNDENWFRNNCEDENDLYDKDGYDMYGYDEDGNDRDGNTEYYYLDKFMDETNFVDIEYWDEK